MAGSLKKIEASGWLTVDCQRAELAQTAETEKLTVTESVDPDELRYLLRCLSQEDCVHSWRNFDVDGSLQEMTRWENELRPTKIFFFNSERGGRRQVIGAATVADKLKRDFPHRGFTVLGRCFILPEFRSRGFYRRLLRYRLDYCREQYGTELNAVHIGSAHHRISRVIKNHQLPGWPTFSHLGEEELRIAGEIRTVGAYLLLLPEYVRRIRQTLAGENAPPCIVTLRRVFDDLQSGEVRNLGMLVKETFEEATDLGWFVGRSVLEIEQLLLFARSVPLVGFHQPSSGDQ